MKLFSAAFSNFEPIPRQYTAEGEDISPPLRWQEVPEGTRSLALIVDDPDAPHGTWDHWIIYNIPPSISVLAPGIQVSHEAIQTCLNTAGTKEYVGPNPPTGNHRYFFKLYALDTLFQLSETSTKADLIKAMTGHILDEAVLVGTYQLQNKK